MSRRAAPVTQAEVARALRAVEQTRAHAIVEIGRDGVIRIIPVSALPPAMFSGSGPDQPRAGELATAPLDDESPIEL